MCKEKLSKKGEEFILNLNSYLVSTGKSEKEIKEFISEAEEHLILGEKEGKSVEDIFGTSPEEYAKSVADEISFDKKEVFESVLLLTFGFFVWTFIGEIKDFKMGISLVEVISIPIIYILTVAGLLFINKKFAFKDKILTIGMALVIFINMLSLIAVGLISDNMKEIIILDRWIVNVVILLSIIISIIISIKIKTWILMLPFIFNGPTIISNFIGRKFDNMSIILATVSCILAYVFMIFEYKRTIKEKC